MLTRLFQRRQQTKTPRLDLDRGCIRALRYLLLLIRGEHTDLRLVYVGPLKELLAPLQDGNPAVKLDQSKLPKPRHSDAPRCTQNETALLDGASCCDPDQGLSSAARQYNNTGPGTAITEHLAETLLLVRPDDGYGFEVDIKVRVYSVISEIVLLQHRIIQLNASFLEVLEHSQNFRIAEAENSRDTHVNLQI